MKKEFERPDLIIILFKDDVIVCSNEIDPDNDENGGGFNYPPTSNPNPFRF